MRGPACRMRQIKVAQRHHIRKSLWAKQSEWCLESDVMPLLFCLPTGQHRGLGTMVSKVQSLKLDTSVWSNEIVQVRVTGNCETLISLPIFFSKLTNEVNLNPRSHVL